MAKFNSYNSPEVNKALLALGNESAWTCDIDTSQRSWNEGGREWLFVDAQGKTAKVWYVGRGRKVAATIL